MFGRRRRCVVYRSTTPASFTGRFFDVHVLVLLGNCVDFSVNSERVCDDNTLPSPALYFLYTHCIFTHTGSVSGEVR